jgi:altronate dehydratase small subunit
MAIQAVIIDPEDNVGVALTDLDSGTKLDLKIDGETRQIKLVEPIPYQHKFSVADIAAGQELKKHGIVIGVATKDIKQGEHVHVHNMTGLRAKAAGK